MHCETPTIQYKTGELTLLNTAQRAPSAYNTQPWRLYPLPDDAYLLEYAYTDRLLSDAGDRNALLSMGAFYETLSMAASLQGKQVTFEPNVVQRADGLELGKVRILSLAGKEGAPSYGRGDPCGRPEPSLPGKREAALDPLAPFLSLRQTNRDPYEYLPLSPKLKRDLLNLGCVLLEPQAVAPLVGKASMMAWQDARFIADLKKWTRFKKERNAPDGMTNECLCLSLLQQQAWNFAMRCNGLTAPLAWKYALHDVHLIHHSAAIAVFSAENLEPLSLFECGRRFLRAWVTINAAAFSCHPMSVVVNQPTVTELAQMAGAAHPVAMLRVGYTFKSAAWSNRREVESLPAPQLPHLSYALSESSQLMLQ